MERAPFVVDLTELGRGPGTMLELDLVEVAPEGWGNPVVEVVPGSTISAQVRFESVIEGVLATGFADCEVAGSCGRCLEPIRDRIRVPFDELFRYADQPDPDDSDDHPTLVGVLADLEPSLRDAIVLALPWAPRCREDCPGLCPECGALLAEDPDHRHDRTDPRWAALAGMLDQDDRPTGAN